MEQLPRPNGCDTATYPAETWQPVPCVDAPDTPLVPAHGAKGATVGDGTDYTAVVPGYISIAQGGFDRITGVKSEYVTKNHRRHANVYSLQLNTQFFNTQTCASLGSPDPQDCFGWEQFVYDTGRPVGAFIEYWLANFGPIGTSCPSDWHTYAVKSQNEVNCWINSAEIHTPIEPIGTLAKLRVIGAAAYQSRSQDFVELLDGETTIYYVAGQNWFPDLDLAWQDAEFNVLGDCCGDRATFNSGSTITVRTQVDSSSKAAPSCASEGFTAESNNLFLAGTPAKQRRSQYPSIVFDETNAASRTPASCATKGSER